MSLTVEQRLASLEDRMNHMDSALSDLGMRPVHYPMATRSHHEWAHEREPWLVKLPHPIETEVFIKTGFLKDYHTEVINFCEDDLDPVEILAKAGRMAFSAWRRTTEPGIRQAIGAWIPEIVASRSDYGICRPDACLKWAERKFAEYRSEQIALLYQHGAIGHDSYQSGVRNLEDHNLHLAQS